MFDLKELFKRTEPSETLPGAKPSQIDQLTSQYIFESNKTVTYDGNTAWDRQKWLQATDLDTLRILRNFQKSKPQKYTTEVIAKILESIKLTKNELSFDLKYISGQAKGNRLNLFPGSLKEKVISYLAKNDTSSLSENYLRKVLTDNEFERIKHVTEHWQKMEHNNQTQKQKRLNEFQSLGLPNELLTTEGQSLIISTHQENFRANLADSGNVADILPEEIKTHHLDITYQENSVSTQSEQQFNQLPDNYQLTDSSGVIDQNYLKLLLRPQEKATIILIGGNLRGCVSSSLESIIESIKSNQPQQVEIHLLLDQTYDNSAYDNYKSFPDDLVRKSGQNWEIYYDNQLIDCYLAKSERKNTRLRFYLWPKTKTLNQTLKDSLAIKQIKQTL